MKALMLVLFVVVASCVGCIEGGTWVSGDIVLMPDVSSDGSTEPVTSPCNDGNLCTEDFFNEVTKTCIYKSVHNGVTCNKDGNICLAGQCVYPPDSGNCVDADPCTIDYPTVDGGCSNTVRWLCHLCKSDQDCKMASSQCDSGGQIIFVYQEECVGWHCNLKPGKGCGVGYRCEPILGCVPE